MFKKRSLQVQMVKTPRKIAVADEEEQPDTITKEEVEAFAKEMMKWTAITVGSVLTLSVVLNTAGTIIVRSITPK